MILYYLKNTSQEDLYRNILYVYIIMVVLYLYEPIITFFLLSKNVKVRLAEYLRYDFDFV